MARELWGTFSVKDHMEPRAFVADVMLYDRLVIPFPPDADVDELGRPMNGWDRWRKCGWDPDRQATLLAILGRLARPIPWTGRQRQDWTDHVATMSEKARQELDYAFKATRTMLTRDLPAHVTAAEAIAAYPSLERLEQDVAAAPAVGPVPASTVAAVIGREFLVPEDPGQGTPDEEMLRRAVELASDSGFRRKRASFNRWWRNFVNGTVTDAAAIKAAVEEMRDLVADERAAARNARIRTGVKYGFVLAGIGVGLLVPAANVVGWVAAGAGAFFKLGGTGIDDYLARRPPGSPSAGAMFHSAERHFGWK